MGLFGLPDITIKWDPIKDVGRMLEDLRGVSEGLVKQIERGDIGKIADAVSAPVRHVVRAGEDLVRGDLEGATGNLVHSFVSASPAQMVLGASSTAREIANHDTVNALTLGYSRDAAEIADKSKSASYGRDIDATDWSVLGRQAVRTAAVAGAIAVAPTAAGYVAEHATLETGIAAAGVLKDPKAAVTKLANEIAPGTGDLINDIITPGPGAPSPRAPASTAPPPTTTVVPGIDSKTLLIAGGVGFLGLVTLIALKQR